VKSSKGYNPAKGDGWVVGGKKTVSFLSKSRKRNVVMRNWGRRRPITEKKKERHESEGRGAKGGR